MERKFRKFAIWRRVTEKSQEGRYLVLERRQLRLDFPSLFSFSWIYNKIVQDLILAVQFHFRKIFDDLSTG